MKNSKRLGWLDAIRGFAILLVVLGHSIERLDSGLGIGMFLQGIDVFIYGFHMSLFFMISGYVYGFRREKNISESFKYFTIRKIIDLGLPYVIFAILVWLGKFIFADFVRHTVTVKDLLMIFVTPVAFTWFLYILLWVSILIKALDIKIRNKTIIWIITLVMVIVGCLFETNIKLIDRVLFYSISYYTGVVLSKKLGKETNNKFVFLIFIIFIAASALREIGYNYSYLKAITGVTGSIVIMFLFIVVGECNNLFYRFLSFCGRITIFIYILHPVVLSAVKVILTKLSITNVAIWLSVLLLSGFAVPIFYYLLGKKIWVLDAVFRPRRYILKNKNKQ